MLNGIHTDIRAHLPALHAFLTDSLVSHRTFLLEFRQLFFDSLLVSGTSTALARELPAKHQLRAGQSILRPLCFCHDLSVLHSQSQGMSKYLEVVSGPSVDLRPASSNRAKCLFQGCLGRMSSRRFNAIVLRKY